ncbi:MAG: hypothetical protein AB9921_07800 [Erysipelotrichaceae bacterium]
MKERLLNLVLRLVKSSGPNVNINETMTFGLPIVMNPILITLFVLAPIVSAIFGYLMIFIGFATPLLKSWLATGGHFGTVIAVQS